MALRPEFPEGENFGVYPLTVGTQIRDDGCSITRYSSRGNPLRLWEAVRVHKIDPRILDCTVYLYPSSVDAKGGNHVGGTGFLMDYSSEVCPHVYAVTAKHNIVNENSPVIRLNSTSGEHEILDVDVGSWVSHPDGDDISVCPIELDISIHRFSSIPVDMFVTQAFVKTYFVGPGDDVFMVGRFVNHEGTQRNLPTVRFGNIAQMPEEPIKHPKFGINQESFLVECHSLGGYSGSPVFWWSPAPEALAHSIRTILGPKLLGVDWCHIQNWGYIYEQDEKTRISEDHKVPINTGMAGVIPAWRLLDLLKTERLVMQRMRDEEQVRRKKDSGVAFDSTSAEQPFTKQDFEDALRKTSRRIKSSELEKEK